MDALNVGLRMRSAQDENSSGSGRHSVTVSKPPIKQQNRYLSECLKRNVNMHSMNIVGNVTTCYLTILIIIIISFEFVFRFKYP